MDQLSWSSSDRLFNGSRSTTRTLDECARKEAKKVDIIHQLVRLSPDTPLAAATLTNLFLLFRTGSNRPVFGFANNLNALGLKQD